MTVLDRKVVVFAVDVRGDNGGEVATILCRVFGYRNIEKIDERLVK